jgi:hypothetical protein
MVSRVGGDQIYNRSVVPSDSPHRASYKPLGYLRLVWYNKIPPFPAWCCRIQRLARRKSGTQFGYRARNADLCDCLGSSYNCTQETLWKTQGNNNQTIWSARIYTREHTSARCQLITKQKVYCIRCLWKVVELTRYGSGAGEIIKINEPTRCEQEKVGMLTIQTPGRSLAKRRTA